MGIIRQVQVGRYQIVRLTSGGHLEQHVVFRVTTQGDVERRSYYCGLSEKQIQESLSRARPEIASQPGSLQHYCIIL